MGASNRSILLVLLVLVSGCVGGRAFLQDANNGIRITSFEVPKEAEFFDQVFFDVKYENVGGTSAENVNVNLLGLEGSWRNSKAVNDILGVAPSYVVSSMEPPLKSENKPGDLNIFYVNYYPPFVPKGGEAVFPVTARVKYTYANTGTLVIPVVTKSLEKIKKDKGESIDGTAKVTNTFAPLQISLKSGPEPLLVDDVIYSNLPSLATQYQDDTYIIQFVNRGDGQMLDVASGGAEGSVVSGEIRIFGTGAEFVQCIGTLKSKTLATFDSSQFDLTKLRSDGSFPIPCKIRVDRSKFGVTQSSTITITVEMRYQYFVEETREIRVKGIEYDLDVLQGITPIPPTATPTNTPNPTNTPTSTPT